MKLGMLFLFGIWRHGGLNVYYHTFSRRDRNQEFLAILVSRYILDIKEIQGADFEDEIFRERRRKDKKVRKFLHWLDLLHRAHNKERKFAMGFGIVLYHRSGKPNGLVQSEYELCKSPFPDADDHQLLESMRLNGRKAGTIIN